MFSEPPKLQLLGLQEHDESQRDALGGQQLVALVGVDGKLVVAALVVLGGELKLVDGRSQRHVRVGRPQDHKVQVDRGSALALER